MLDEKEKKILSHLRTNCRKPLSAISKQTGIPTSTVFEKVKKLEKNVISKNVSLIDFNGINHPIRTNIVFKINSQTGVMDFLQNNNNINTFLRLANGLWHVEAVFKDMNEQSTFSEYLNSFDISIQQEYNLVEELKKEEFNLD